MLEHAKPNMPSRMMNKCLHNISSAIFRGTSPVWSQYFQPCLEKMEILPKIKPPLCVKFCTQKTDGTQFSRGSCVAVILCSRVGGVLNRPGGGTEDLQL